MLADGVSLGPDSFGGDSAGENFHCLPDHHWTKCSHIEKQPSPDASGSPYFHCCVRGQIGEDLGECSFAGVDYRTCSRFLSLNIGPVIDFGLQARILGDLS